MGALFRGFCHPTTTDAANAWCGELALQLGGGSGAGMSMLGGSGAGQAVGITGREIVYGSCGTVSVAGQVATVSKTLGFYSNTSTTSMVTGSYTALSISSPGTQTVTTPVSAVITFPTCSVDATETDQITSVNTVFGVALAAVAVIWGVRRVLAILNGNQRD